MFSNPDRNEIDHHTSKLIVGVIAISLASVTNFFTEHDLTSISASYHEGYWARDYFVGSLFAIFAFLMTYNGYKKSEMFLSKIAAFSALGVAFFPCECVIHDEIISGVHGFSAAIMFLILAAFCYLFHERAKKKELPEAKLRSIIYLVCGAVIVISILVLATDHFLDNKISDSIERLTFYGENAGLIAFGVAWLTASRILPFLTNPTERLKLFS